MNSQEYADTLGVTLNTDGWSLILEPAVERLRNNAVQLLLMPGVQKELRNREGNPTAVFTDDYLKGKIDTLNWFLRWRPKLADLARELAELEKADNPPTEGLGTPYAPQNGETTSPAAS